MDKATASRSRMQYAKVCVEVSAADVIPETLVLETGPELTVEIPVEVLWKPDQCSQCGVFGNSTTKCLKRPAKQQWVVKGKNVILAISIVEIGRIK